MACVATLAGITLDEAIRLTGKRGATRTADLRRGLQRAGLIPAMRMKRTWGGRAPLDARGVASLKRGKDKHWVVVWDGRVLDPAYGEDPAYLPDVKMTSVLHVDQF